MISFKAIPTLRILEYNRAMEFYTGFLGFKIDWEHRFGPDEPVYMQISRDDLVFHLSENIRFKPGATVYIETEGIKDFHRQLTEKNELVPSIVKTNWGTMQLELEDPFENLLRFNENM